jgi:PAS domain S-box-containing protein
LLPILPRKLDAPLGWELANVEGSTGRERGKSMNASELQIFESVGALVVVLDVDCRIVYWNASCSTLTGYSLDEVRGRRYWEFLLAPEEVAAVKAIMTELAVAEHSAHFANYWLTKSGERRWITGSNSSKLDAAGTLQYFLKTGIDQTERKQAEEALRISEAKLSGIITIAADAIISVDDEERIVLYNQGAETIFGWSAAEALGKRLELLVPARLRHAHGQHVQAFGGSDVTARRMGERQPTILGLRKSGQEFPAHAAISKLAIDGKTLSTVVLRDITEQVQRDKENELLSGLGAALMATFADQDEAIASVARVVVQDLADCCIVDLVDADGKLKRMKVLHRDPDKSELCARLRRLRFDRERSYPPLADAESKLPWLMSEVPPGYLESIAQDAEHLAALRELDPRSLLAVPLLARGDRLGVLWLVSSHATRRYGDEDLRLAQEVAVRAALGIENARLHQDARRAMRDQREANEQMVTATLRAQALADEAEAAKALTEESERELRQVAEFRELFIGIVGHDLRNPLSSISLAASLLRKHGKLDERDDKNVTRIINGGQRMSRMISQLLDLTRARLGGGFPLDSKPTDLREVCQAVIEEFEAPIDVEIEGDVSGTWDPDRLTELLSNIAGNAIEHAEPGTTLLILVYPAGSEVVVEVSNQGNPIPPDVLASIFEPFRRAKQREKSASGNLGLGLYIAKQIVISHGGTIEAHCQDGITTFVIRLPRSPPVTQPDRPSDGAATQDWQGK